MTSGAPADAAARRSTGFEVLHATGSSGPRVGLLKTAHGACETPCFMPIATRGSLRALTFDEAEACGTKIVMANAWHLSRDTSAEAFQNAGGAHAVIGWRGLLFTDSGGYQVFSLRDSSEIAESGVRLGSDEDALTPEHVVRMQKVLGSDVMMVLDDCAPFPCPRDRIVEAVRRTSLWASQSIRAHREIAPCYNRQQDLWGIVQGGDDEELRKQSVDEIAALEFDGYGLGGLSIGMPRETIRRMSRLMADRLPFDKPRHLLGVGLPPQILEGIEDGVDTFDCVLPIRKAERGYVYTTVGEVSCRKLPPRAVADAAIDPSCECPTCRTCSRERLALLFRTDKDEAARLAAMHNLSFYHKVLREARDAIRANRFSAYKDEFVARYACGPDVDPGRPRSTTS